MSAIECQQIYGNLRSIDIPGEKHFGMLEIRSDGRVRIWKTTHFGEDVPTDVFYPGFVSAVRALLRGEA